jgi:Kef-type K+ transport system membrane component KefB
VTVTTGKLLLDTAVILVAARAGALLLARFRQPAVIGEIIAGVALGPTLLGALPGDPSSALFGAGALAVLQPIGQLGLALFMFTVGWDLDLAAVRRSTRAATSISIVSVLLPFGLGLAVAAYLYSDHDTVAGAHVPFWPFALFVGAALAMTAFPVLARILRDKGLDGTPVGSITIAAAAIGDILGWGVLAVALAALASGGPWAYVRIVIEIAAFVLVMLTVVQPLLGRALRSSTGAAIALIVPGALLAAAITDAIGVHAVFGAFLAGLAMPRIETVPDLAEVRGWLTPVVALLGSIYFVASGMGVDIPALRPGDLGAFAVIIVAACAGKFLGAFVAARAAGQDRHRAASIGVLMNTRGLIEIVLLTVGRDAGLIDDRLYTLLALMAIVTTLLTAPLLEAITPELRRGRARRGRSRRRDQPAV